MRKEYIKTKTLIPIQIRSMKCLLITLFNAICQKFYSIQISIPKNRPSFYNSDAMLNIEFGSSNCVNPIISMTSMIESDKSHFVPLKFNHFFDRENFWRNTTSYSLTVEAQRSWHLYKYKCIRIQPDGN